MGDPVIGRFYSNDPVGFVQGSPVHSFGRYTYANNNPYKYNDPDGEFAHIAIGAAVGGLIGGIAYAATTDNFSWGGLAGNVATGAVVGGVTAAVPGAIAAGTLNFGGKVANVAAMGGNAAAAGAAGNVANQAMAGGDIDTGQALVAGAANAIGLGAGQFAAPAAKAFATSTVPAKAGLPVVVLGGKTHMVGAQPAQTYTSESLTQFAQDAIGETVSAGINNIRTEEKD